MNVDFGSYSGIGTLANGSLVTLQVQFNGGDGNLFQCADLVLLSDYQAPSNETCSNDVSLQANATQSVTSVAASATTSSAPSASSATQSQASGAQQGLMVPSLLVGAMMAALGVVAVSM